MKKQILFLIFTFGTIFSYSQTYTLADCINYAYAHRTELQKQESAQSYYNKDYSYSKLGLLPSVSGKSNYQLSYDRKNELTQSATTELASELILFNGFQLFNSIKQSALLKDRNKTYTEKIRNDIKLKSRKYITAFCLHKQISRFLKIPYNRQSSKFHL